MGVLTWEGADARFLEANAASAAEVARRPREVCGRSALEIGIPLELVQGWGIALDSAHRARRPLDVRWQISTSHGFRTLTTRVLPLPDPRGHSPRFGHITHDWTGSGAPRPDDAAERERLAGRLASALANDIEAPLEQLLGLIGIAADEVGVLAESNPELELEECGRVLAEAALLARRAHLPVREFQEFLRPVSSIPGPFDASECLRSALRLAGSELKRWCAPRADGLMTAFVVADEPRLRRALVLALLEVARGPGGQLARTGDLHVSMATDDRQLELVLTRTDPCPLPEGDFASCAVLLRDAGGVLRVERHARQGFRVRITLPLLPRS